MAPPIRQSLERHRVVTYVVLTYAVSWSLFALWRVLPESLALAKTIAFVGGGFGPMIAAVVLLAARGKRVQEWLRAIFRPRIPVRYYVVALVFPPMVLLVAGAVHVVGFGAESTLDALPRLWEYPLFLAFVFFLGGGQEEPGWRGYLLPVLQSRYSALTAAVLIGVVWAVWHLPLFVFPGTIQSEMAFWLYVPQVVGTSVVLTWLANVARGSVLPAMLLHAGANAVVNYYPVGGSVGATSITGYGLLTGVVLFVAGALVVRYGTALRPTGDEPRIDDFDTVVASV